MSTPALSGRCNCGAITFRLTDAPLTVGYCHCTRCQRRTGTSQSALARVDGTALSIDGEELLSGWTHPDGGFTKLFCSVCGSHLFSRNPEDPAQMAVRLSAFDGDPGLHPTFRQFVDNAAAWEPIPEDGLIRHGGSANRSPAD